MQIHAKIYKESHLQASHYIGLVALVQSSPESPIIFSLLHRILSAEPIEELRISALAAGVSKDDFTVRNVLSNEIQF